jgi:hypothetical protein
MPKNYRKSLRQTQQGRPQGTVLRFDRQVVNADYDNRVQDEYLTQNWKEHSMQKKYRKSLRQTTYTRLNPF